MAIALALVGIFFFQMFRLVNRAEQLAQSEAKIGRLVDVLDEIVVDFTSAVSLITANLGAGTVKQQLSPDQYKQHALELFQLARQQAPDAKIVGVLDEAQPLVDDVYWMLQQTEHREPLTQNYLSALRLFSEIEVKVKHTAPRLALIRDEMIQQRTRLQATRDQSIASIDRLKSQILAGLLGALGFAAVLVLAFLRDITGRLSTLVKNAEDIPNGKPLTRTVVGSDELSYLDQVLHSVTNKLNASAEYRKSMMSMVAHDLRAPILSSKLSLDLLTSKRPDATVESEVGTIDGIKGDLNHIIVLLEDMLAIEKLESGHLVLDKTVFDLSTLVDDCIRMLAGLAAAKSVSFDKKVPSLIVHADRLRIMQVLQNLLTNAIKNSESQTSVVITAEIERATVRVSVIDHGRGISPEDQKRIFDRFYTLDSKTGFGLGLAISKMILVEHGGEISVSSRVGSGSTFWFTLPYEEDEQVSP